MITQRLRRFGPLMAALMLLLTLCVGFGTASAAQDSATTSRDVAAGLKARFRALPVQNGLILVPRERRGDVDNIELRDGAIAINGTVVTGAELRERLGRDADLVMRLSYLDLTAQRELLDIQETPRRTESDRRDPDRDRPADVEAPPTAVPTPSEPQVEREARDERRFGRRSDGRVRIGGSITVPEDEDVHGPVVAVGGSVEVNGRVSDAVVSVGGSVRLGPTADIRGDVTVVGGELVRDPNAMIRGQVNEVSFGMPHFRVGPLRGEWLPFWPWDGAPWRSVRFFGTILRVVLLGLLAALVLMLVPRAVERTDYVIRTQPLKAVLVGFFAQLFFIPLLVITVVLLLVSIIGIPLLALVPFGVVLFLVAMLLGFTGAASGLGRAISGRHATAGGSAFGFLLVGLAVVCGVTVMGRLLGIAGGPLSWVGGLLVLIGFLVEYVAWTLGLGGALLTRFGRRGRLYPPPLDPVPAFVNGEDAAFDERGPIEPPPLP